MKRTPNASVRGFTLIEILLAVGIFALVVGSAYMVLRAGIDSYARGSKFVDLYQNSRAAMRKVEIDLRRAVSPAQTGWNIMPEPPDPGENPEYDAYYDEQQPEPQEEKIVFNGDSNQVRFVIKEDIPGKEPPWDLSEVRYFVNTDTKRLVRETLKSVVELNDAEWRLRQSMAENETDFYYELDAVRNTLENQESKRRLVIGERIKSVKFRYHDGNDWADSWDSQEQVNPPETEEEAQERTRVYKKGLPHLVEITLELEDGDKIRSAVEIPGWGKNAWYWEEVDPNAFGEQQR